MGDFVTLYTHTHLLKKLGECEDKGPLVNGLVMQFSGRPSGRPP